ncbi:MAG TPA: hypothetical protein VGC76_15945 [Pyrinomonadaceae bacterium]|jgi:hypothetical protein
MIRLDLKNAAAATILLFAATIFVCGQDASPTPDLETILKNADEQAQNYRLEFKNLLSEEKKTFETFDKNGDRKKRTVVESNFIIFQSLNDESVSSEYRSVVKVNDKNLGDTEKRSNDLFEQLARASSVKQELEKIQKESSRYDKNLQITGLTLLQTPILADYARPFFDFKLTNRENTDGADVFVVEYRQTKPSPYVLIDERADESKKITIGFDLGLPKILNKSNVFLRGKLWIDAQTFQIRREERELTGQTDGAAGTLILFRGEFEYQPSDFGILVPRKITYSYFQVKSKDNNVSAKLDTRATFEYAKFRKSRVEVKID